MKAALLLTAGLAHGLSSQAATLEQVVRTVAPPSQAAGKASGWPALDRLGIQWHKAGPQQRPAGYTRFGTVQLDGLGKTTVFFIGSRTALVRAPRAARHALSSKVPKHWCHAARAPSATLGACAPS